MAGEAAIASALFERLSFLEVTTPNEAIETLKMLIQTRRPRGSRVGFATSSGSYAVLGADQAEVQGLTLHRPQRATRGLGRLLPPFVQPANPLDIATKHDATEAEQEAIFRAFLADDYDIALQVMCYPPAGGWALGGWDRSTAAFARAVAARDLPRAFINTLPETLPEAAGKRMRASGMTLANQTEEES